MHELQVTESILNIALKHAEPSNVTKIVKIHLDIGDLSDLENEWIQHYFDYLSKDTIAEKAELVINRKPIVLKCDTCSHSFEINKNEMKDIACPECRNQKCSLESGREYYIKNMEVL